MKAYIITIDGDPISQSAANNCIDSHTRFKPLIKQYFHIEKFDAIRPEQVDEEFKYMPFTWTYPWDQPRIDFKSGLKLTPYTTANRKKRMACFLSHYHLWQQCARQKEPLLILEHDALFIRPFNYEFTMDSNYGIIGINNPLGATRRADIFDSQIQTMRGEDLDADGVLPVPTIDSFDIPQGLAGNSAYVIKPLGAEELLDLINDYGAWPNDAIMCKQLLPNILGVTKKYYTKVQGTRSTTTL